MLRKTIFASPQCLSANVRDHRPLAEKATCNLKQKVFICLLQLNETSLKTENIRQISSEIAVMFDVTAKAFSG